MTDLQVVSYSELSTFRDCPLKHYLSYDMRYTRPPDPNGPLPKGTLWHEVMEDHYKLLRQAQQQTTSRRIAPEDEADLLRSIRDRIEWRWAADPNTGEQSEIKSLIEWMYDGYVERYGADLQWRIDGIERYIESPLLDEEGNATRFILKAKIDLLVFSWETQSRWVVDHKSGANLPTQMDLELDDQFGLYQWLLQRVNRPVAGSIHSAARTTRNMGDYIPCPPKKKPQTLDQRFHRTFLSRSRKELVNLALDAYGAAFAAYPPEGYPRPKYSAPDPRSCGWKCDFKEVHLMARKGRDLHSALTEFNFVINKTRH